MSKTIVDFIADIDGDGERDVVGEGLASRIVKALDAAGFVIVPKEDAASYNQGFRDAIRAAVAAAEAEGELDSATVIQALLKDKGSIR